jgi:RNA ligase
MFYEFPHDMSLAEVSGVVARHNARLGTQVFIEADRGDFVLFNYLISFSGTFPAFSGDREEDREYAILRECRGLTFSKATGKVVNRKFHKFFNLNERPEVLTQNVDWSENCDILEKMDGSMITPLPTSGGMRWATKMGLTDIALQVDRFVERNLRYEGLARECVSENKTPIFEWCSRQQRIVIDHPVDRLVLLAIRDNDTGVYSDFGYLGDLCDFHRVELVQRRPGSLHDVNDFVTETRDLVETEGWVIAFQNGHKLKVKADEYCIMHAAKDNLSSEKNVLALILEDKIDDTLPLLAADDRQRVVDYADAVQKGISTYMEALAKRVAEQYAGYSKRDLALAIKDVDGLDRTMMFSIFDGQDPVEVGHRVVAKHLGSATRVDLVRHLWGGVRWGWNEVTE